MKGVIRAPWNVLVVLSMMLALLLATAQSVPGFAQESLVVEIGKSARLLEGGQAVELKVKVRCSVEGFEVLEAFVYVTQDGFTSQFAGLPVTCSQGPNTQVSKIRVEPLDSLFHTGQANATAFVLLIDPVTSETISTGDTEIIQIH